MLYVKHSRFEILSFLHPKLALIAWGIFYAVRPPGQIVSEIGYPLVYLSAAFAVIGCVIASIGLIMTRSDNLKLRFQGGVIEAAGLVLGMSGPFVFFTTLLYLTYKFKAVEGISVALLGYVAVAAMASRFVSVRRSYKKGV